MSSEIVARVALTRVGVIITLIWIQDPSGLASVFDVFLFCFQNNREILASVEKATTVVHRCDQFYPKNLSPSLFLAFKSLEGNSELQGRPRVWLTVGALNQFDHARLTPQTHLLDYKLQGSRLDLDLYRWGSKESDQIRSLCTFHELDATYYVPEAHSVSSNWQTFR